MAVTKPRYVVLVWLHDHWGVTFAHDDHEICIDAEEKATVKLGQGNALVVDTLQPSADEVAWSNVKRIAKEHGVVELALHTSDQDYYGFVLSEETMTANGPITPDEYAALEAVLDEHLQNLAWDGVVGEDRGGYATVTL